MNEWMNGWMTKTSGYKPVPEHHTIPLRAYQAPVLRAD